VFVLAVVKMWYILHELCPTAWTSFTSTNTEFECIVMTDEWQTFLE